MSCKPSHPRWPAWRFFGVLLFVPAGTVNYWQAWVFIAVFIAATMLPSIYLAVNDPEALRRRCTPVRPRKRGPCKD